MECYVSDSGRIYHQGSVARQRCEDREFIAKIAQNIARQFQDPNSRILVRGSACSVVFCTGCAVLLQPRLQLERSYSQ